MNTQSTNETNSKKNIELRIRTMRTLWTAMFSSIGFYFVFGLIRGRSPDNTENSNLSFILLGVAVLTTVTSFLIKNKLLANAVERQQMALVQQAYIATWAITEVAALLGLVDFFATGNRYYYVLFIIAAVGMLLHFPRREPVESAAFKRGLI